jgi:hypothetical protein
MTKTLDQLEQEFQDARQAYRLQADKVYFMPVSQERRAAARKKLALLDAEQAAFKALALTTAGIADHPKAERLYAIAWEDAYSEGYDAVGARVEELAELLKE